MTEHDLLHAFIERVPYRLPHARIFRRNIINVETSRGYRVRNGIAGQADAYALVRGGRHVELETKAAAGRLAPVQKAWRAYCASFEIPHLVLRARKDEAPADTVDRWIDELQAVL
jgi:hypothetical protein